jgi:DNA end-binding protein Ku
MPRAIWKGHLSIAAISCPVALHAAASTADRVTLHMVNRKTGNRLRREFVDSETDRPVAREDQTKGYEIAPDSFVQLTADEIASAVPESDKTLTVERFVRCDEVDPVYFDRPYFLSPDGAAGDGVFALICAGLAGKSVAAIARTVLFRRVRTLLIRAQEDRLVAATLNYADEVRPAAEVFDEIPKRALDKEMIALARHIISTREGAFDPAAFEDRYETALAELVRARIEGRELRKPRAPKPSAGSDLLAALRKSAGRGDADRTTRKARRPEQPAAKDGAKRKAG